MKIRILLFAFVLTLVPFLFRPTLAYACDSLLCIGEILGLTDAGEQAVQVGDRDAERREKETDINAKRDIEVNRINSDGELRLEQARGQNLRDYMSGQVAAQDVIGKYDVLKTSINAIAAVKIKELDVVGDIQLAQINGTVDLEKTRIENGDEAHPKSILGDGETFTDALKDIFFLCLISGVSIVIITRRARKFNENDKIPVPAPDISTMAYPVPTTYRYVSEDEVIQIPQPIVRKKMEMVR